jgi:replicative DNA helicase
MSTNATPKPWMHISEMYKQGLEYIDGRRKGQIKSIRTPWVQFNEAGMDGLEWNTINVIGGRPGSGKTLIANQITREAFDLNPDQEFCVLDCQWEMLARTMAVRDMSSALNKSVREMNSASGQMLSDDDFNAAVAYCNSRSHLPVYTIERPWTVPQFEKNVEAFINEKQLPTICTVDHSILFRKDSSEDDKFETLYNLGEALTRMKRKLPIIFIVLSQLNRNAEREGRLEPGTHGNHLLDSDLFGADALLMHTDILFMVNRPAKYSMDVYGPEKFEVSKDLLAGHFNKVRNGDPRMVFFQAQFDQMKIRDWPVNGNGERLPNQIQTKSVGSTGFGGFSTKNFK